MDINSHRCQEVIDVIARHCPEAMTTYLHCHNRADSIGRVFFPRKMVEEEMSESFRLFRNNLKKLARENLLEWLMVDPDTIQVTIADISDD